MKKLVLSGIVTLFLVGGVGAVWAAEDVTPMNPNQKTFEEMLPFMKKMHPGVSDETFKEMYNSCHGEGGMMGNGTPQSMMKNL